MAEIKKISTELQLLDKFLDTSGDAGTSGQILSSTGTGINWVSGGSLPGGPYLPLSAGSSYPLTGILYAGQGVKFTGGTIAAATTVLHTNNVVYARGGSSGMFLQNADGSDGIFIANDHIRLETGSAERMRILSGGNVGIGTTSPTEKLEVKSGSIFVNGEDNGIIVDSISKRVGLMKYAGHEGVIARASTNDFGIVRCHTADIFDGSSLTYDFYVSGTGNVGIGTTGPRGKLDIVGNTDNDADFLTIQDNDTSAGSHRPSIRFRSDTAQIGQIVALDSSMRFSVGTTETSLLEIASSGNVGIGTTSPDSKLEVITSGTNTVLELDNSDSNYTVIQYNASGATKGFSGFNSGFMLFGGEAGTTTRLQSGGSYAATILENGNFGIGTTSPVVKLQVNGTNASVGTIGTPKSDWYTTAYNGIQIADGTTIWGRAGDSHFSGNYYVKNNSGSAQDTYINALSAHDLWLDNSSGSLKYRNAGLGGAGNAISFNTRFVVLNNGNFGIGTTSPIDKLNVNGGTGDATTQQPKITVTRTSSTGNVLAGKMILTTKPSDPTNHGNLVFQVKTTASAGESSAYYTNAITIDGKNAKVGIGTASPDKDLTVGGVNPTHGINLRTKSGSSEWLLWQVEQYFSQEGYMRMFNDNVAKIQFRANGDSYFVGGDVGIGTTSPDDLLEIEGDADVYARVHYTGNGSNSPADVCGIKLEHGRATWNIRNTYNGGVSYPDGAFSINSGTKANALTILNNTSSDIGIGTNAPTAKLHVNGSDFLVSNGGEEAINVDLDNYVYKFGDISGGENQSYFGISSANAQAYFLNCNVGIGTSSPNVPLDVTVSDTGSSFNDGAVQLSNTTSASSGGATVMNIRNNYGGGFGTLIKFFRTSTSSSIANISFNSGGTAVNYNTGSDYRLKEDLQTFNGLDILSNISVYNYKWKGVDFRGYGVIAHELQPIFPDAVTGEKDAEEMQSVDYSKLVPVLIKSVQELKKEIELLKQQLNK